MSKIDLKESFDIEVQKREVENIPKMDSNEEAIMTASTIAISGRTSIDHKDSKGNTIDFEEGSNLIVTAGKKGIIDFIQGTLKNFSGTATDIRRFDRIALGWGGDTSVASTDMKLSKEFDNKASVSTTHNGSAPSGADGANGGGAFDFVKDAKYNATSPTGLNDVNNHYPRELLCVHATSDVSGTHDFYMTDAEDSGLTSTWYAKFTVSGLSGYGWSGTPSIIINEAGIVNQVGGITGATWNDDTSGTNFLLARRTFTNKQVKDDDTLTITWKITIK